MAVGTIGNLAPNSLEFFEFFDPNARFNYGTKSEISLVSRDGYELVLKGDDFKYGSGNTPKDGTITDIFLYDQHGDLVGRIDDVSYSLVKYYDTVVDNGNPDKFTADLLSGDDDLAGGSARDKLQGYGGDDLIKGFFGHDTLIGDGGADTLNGGDGDDNLFGGSGADSLLGGDGEDLLVGAKGDDILAGGYDDDRLDGGAGNDTLSGDAGFDSLAGGGGDDSLVGGGGGDQIEAGDGNDFASGGGGNDFIGAGAGNDTVTGGDGKDEIYGDNGADSLSGDSGDDALSGGAGADTLIGGAGFDTLFGGGGDDVFQFVKQEHGSDTILDFDRGDDLLAFKASGFDNLDADFDLVTGKNPEADTGDGTFLYNTKSHELFWDANGDGKGKEFYVATLDGVKDLDKGDFLIV